MNARQNLFIGVYLVVQLLLPMRGILQDKYDTRGSFSWNMYSQNYKCKIDFQLVDLRGRESTIPYHETLNRPNSAIKLAHRDNLRRYNAWLCDEMRAYDDDFAGVYAKADCSLNGGPRVDLTRRGIDVCSAPGYGVLE